MSLCILARGECAFALSICCEQCFVVRRLFVALLQGGMSKIVNGNCGRNTQTLPQTNPLGGVRLQRIRMIEGGKHDGGSQPSPTET